MMLPLDSLDSKLLIQPCKRLSRLLTLPPLRSPLLASFLLEPLQRTPSKAAAAEGGASADKHDGQRRQRGGGGVPELREVSGGDDGGGWDGEGADGRGGAPPLLEQLEVSCLVDLVCRFYVELCSDLFSGSRQHEMDDEAM
ncbi:hypothetical protein B296_00051757 [Ensete ventricosum]|uniref:Uncharacterized protein n=1 Tax=Ensete ventricosum TaxID=4639 RepID=A0A426YFF0_ENSVE|nr:hypothetical protein B296_00051757 [Ensete ventricosum]